MASKSKFGGLSSFDAYAKTLDDFRIKTSTGGTVTILSILIICVLSIYEFVDYNTPKLSWELSVDKSRTETMPINFNITFPKIPCYLLSLDSVQATGEYKINLESHIFKARLDKGGNEVHIEKFELKDELKKKSKESKEENGVYCGSCYSAKPEGTCCNTCDDVRKAYIAKGWNLDKIDSVDQCIKEGYVSKKREQAGEGCNMHGTLTVKKMPGVFHIALGESFNFMGMHMHASYGSEIYDYSHTINSLSFGEVVSSVVNPLDGEKKTPRPGPIKFQYFLNVVATHLNYLDGSSVNTNQYSITQHEEEMDDEESSGLPGVFFKFEISPMLVTANETKKSFASFLTSLCAIVGGIITVAGIVDSALYNAERTFRKKVELGKAS